MIPVITHTVFIGRPLDFTPLPGMTELETLLHVQQEFRETDWDAFEANWKACHPVALDSNSPPAKT